MTKQEAINFLGQVCNDFIVTLPVSAREGTRLVAQQALNTLTQPNKPKRSKKDERQSG